MKLIIVESPSKAKKISTYLDKNYKVVSTVGHIRDLPKSNQKAIDIEGGFIPHYVISPGKDIVVADLQKLAEQADDIFLATDPDREGEAIAWHISEVANLKNAKRIAFHAVTKPAVLEAMEHPRPIDQNLRKAQEARRVLDRLVGYDLSGLIWKKVRYGLSAGRVQSPALRIVMEREREIRAFISHKFWVIEADVLAKNLKFAVTCSEEPTDFKEVERILAVARKESWKVISVNESEVARSPKAPFMTSTMQQVASSRLGFSPSRTMSIAQRLYEAGHITYLRTDSTNLDKSATDQAAQVIEKEFGKGFHEFRAFATKSKNAQEAHEAIRPTDFSVTSAGTNDEQKKLYQLIRQRALASQMADARTLRTKIVANVESEKSNGGNSKPIPDFTANGSRILFEGWLKADPEARGEDVELPKVVEGEALKIKDVNTDVRSIEKETQPPARYTEAGLVAELTKRGIGRPATLAGIISTIQTRGYVEKEGRSLKPTDTGDVVSSFLEANFMDYINDTFTAEMEDSLDEIALGEKDYTKTLSDFYKPFHKEIKLKEKDAKITNLGEADPKYKCPKCGSPMIIKLGRGGKFLSCSRYPDCDGALTMEGIEIKKDEPIGVDPTTGLPIYVLVGRFGPYVQLGDKLPKKSKAKKPKKTAEEKATEKAAAKTAKEAGTEIVKEKGPKPVKPKLASIPKGADITKVTVEDALKYLTIPRVLGNHPQTGQPITASVGRFGPYVVHESDFRSVKSPDDIYKIELPRALEIFAQPKALRRGAPEKVRVIGQNPKTGKDINLYKNANGFLLKRGFTSIYLPKEIDPEKITVEQAMSLLSKK